MKPLQLPPAEIAPFTTEAYLPKVTVRSQLIYVLVLLALVMALGSLPFIKVDVSVQSTGMIRPAAERNELKSLVAGTVAHVYVRDNQRVKLGQPLLRLQTDMLDTKLRLNRVQQREKELYISDLKALVQLDKQSLKLLSNLESPLYRQQYEQFRWAMTENLQMQRKRKREWDINQKLLDEKVVAALDVEDKAFAYESVQAQYQTAFERQIGEWQTALMQYQMAVEELKAQERQYLQERELYTIKAPVEGHIHQWIGKYAGSYLQSGELLGIISPDSNLIVECYVAPKDIGLLHKGMKARMQLDAFDYNQWGFAEGVVQEISNDLNVAENQQPFFKVKCWLLQTHLSLPNGYVGQLKKGMTLRTHFIVTERSLFDLLYDKADDWLNPKAPTIRPSKF